ncbi:MAG: type II secretion system protein [bacterium]|nr:type II secretion system protein [bacterium]
MTDRLRKLEKAQKGYSLIEMLIVTAMIVIMATIPVALLRKSREKVFELDALRALRTVAVAYENYYSTHDFQYPNYQSSGAVTENNQFHNPEAIWAMLNRENLLPGMYSGFYYDRKDLMARGYRFSIFPSDFGDNVEAGAKNSYAFAMIAYDGGVGQRDLVMVHGMRSFTTYPTAIPRAMGGMNLISTTIFAMPNQSDR